MNKLILILGGLVYGLAVSALVSFLYGLFFMLAVGVIHAEWIHTLPTIGFWWAVLISFLLRSGLTGNTTTKVGE